MNTKKATIPENTVVVNKRARHDYFVEETYEAGLVLRGWEVKSLRANRANLNESYVIIKDAEAFIIGLHLSPLPTIAGFTRADPTRTRKLLLKRKEINKLIGAVERKGFTLVPLKIYWQRGRAKLAVALAKGKQKHDKRASIKERDWNRQKERLLKS